MRIYFLKIFPSDAPDLILKERRKVKESDEIEGKGMEYKDPAFGTIPGSALALMQPCLLRPLLCRQSHDGVMRALVHSLTQIQLSAFF